MFKTNQEPRVLPDLAHRQKDAGHEGFSVHGVMSNCQDFAGATEDDFLMEGVTFKGLFITIEDKEASAAGG